LAVEFLEQRKPIRNPGLVAKLHHGPVDSALIANCELEYILSPNGGLFQEDDTDDGAA
jgi:hypothetical protein